MDDWKLKVRTL